LYILKTVFQRIALALFFILPLCAQAASLAARFMPGVPYYFEDFEPQQKPWAPPRNLNFEEVFKNYQYYEIVVETDGSQMTVQHFIQGRKINSEMYEILPDGALRKK